jgi:hypothetical protein
MWNWQARLFARLAVLTGRAMGGEPHVLKSYDVQDALDVMMATREDKAAVGGFGEHQWERPISRYHSRALCAGVLMSIIETVDPGSWADNGGDEAAGWCVGPCILVAAPTATHDRIGPLVAALKRARPDFEAVVKFSNRLDADPSASIDQSP